MDFVVSLVCAKKFAFSVFKFFVVIYQLGYCSDLSNCGHVPTIGLSAI
jgi:hypothetical protein